MFSKATERSVSFFSPKSLGCGLPKSSWEVKRLNNSSNYCYNIPDYQGKQADPRFIEPHCVLYAQCHNPRALFDDLIITRHKNKTSQFQGKELISFMVAARNLVEMRFIQAFKDNGIPPTILLYYEDDERTRVGLTTAWDDVESIAKILKMLGTIDKLEPLPSLFRETFPLLLSENLVESKLESMPIDKTTSPAYFKHSKTTMKLRPYFANYQEDDQTIPTELPLIHRAILEQDQTKIDAILQTNPELADQKDPWGIKASRLAFKLGPMALYESFVSAKKHIIFKSLGAQDEQLKEPLILNTWKKTGYNALVHMGFNPNAGTPEQKLAKARVEYETLINTPMPRRSSLHLSCINGQINDVKAILNKAPELLNAQDPRGYTPLLLAAANGHADLVRWLLTEGACPKSIEHSTTSFGVGVTLRLIDNAATPEVLQAVLKVSNNPNELTERLQLAIRENNVRMARYIAYYLKKSPKYKGLSALELAVSLSEKYGPEMVQTLLMTHNTPVGDGHYDEHWKNYLQMIVSKAKLPLSLIETVPNVPPEIYPMLQEHNHRFAEKHKKRVDHVKFINDNIEGDVLTTYLYSQMLSITLRVKRVAELTQTEIDKIHLLFFKNFELISDNTHERQQAYLQDALSDDDDKPSYINLFYDEDKLVAFLTYELWEEADEKTTVFHTKLAANLNEDSYKSQRFISIALRPIAAIKLLTPANKLVVYAKAIYPGLGLSVALPSMQTEYYPKYQHAISESFVKKIVEATGETMEDGKIVAKLRVPTQTRALDVMNPVINYFFDEVGKDGVNAMALCYEVTNSTLAQYTFSVASHNIDAHTLKDFASTWDAFYRKTAFKSNTLDAKL